jgi:phosphate transport system substrate-binding protein
MKKHFYILLTVLIVCIVSGFFIFKNYHKEIEKKIDIDGSDTMALMVSDIAAAFMSSHEDYMISVKNTDSSQGLSQFLKGNIDIANSSRRITEDELQTAKKNNINVGEFILAKDAVVFIVNPKNSVSKLTFSQLGDIYLGKIKNWKEVGGKDAKIDLFGREKTSGTYSFVIDKLVKGDVSKQDVDVERGSNQSIVDSVINDVNAIGYIGIEYSETSPGSKRDDIKIINVAENDKADYYSPYDDGAILNNKYPLTRKVYQYFSTSSLNIKEFLQFEMSNSAKEIIKNNGFYENDESDDESDTIFINSLK